MRDWSNMNVLHRMAIQFCSESIIELGYIYNIIDKKCH